MGDPGSAGEGSRSLTIPRVFPGFAFGVFAVVLAFAFNGCEKAPLRASNRKASGSAGGYLLLFTDS
jgi:hypothetical protein